MNENMTYDDRTIAPGIVGKTMIAGRYCVVRKLGEGGMGTVWLAEDTKLKNHLVAIKMLPSILVNNKRAYEQVQKEALVTLNLAHPNIATVRAFEEDNGNPFLVMDYIDGQTLDDYLAEKGTLTEAETIKLLKPVADALDYAHTQGVVHRDVKPGNVMVDKDGVPFVLDFGIAREVQETMTRVTGKQSSGTLMYLSPEQLNGEEPAAAQDVYSFAAMAYECLKGKPPFVRGCIEDQIKHKPPAPLDSSIAINGSVMAGLAKTSDKRPKSCAEVLAGGTRFVASAPSAGKSRKAAVFIGALAALAIGGGIWWGIGREQTKPAPQVVEKVVEKVVQKPAQIVTNVVEKVVHQPSPVVTQVVEKVVEKVAKKPAPVVKEIEEPKLPVTPPPVDEEDKRRELELLAESSAYVLASEMENAAELIAAEPEDVRRFFESDISEFEKLRTAGVNARDDLKYVAATNCFMQAKQRADALKQLVTRYGECQTAKHEAVAAKRLADAVDAKSAFAMRYAEAKRKLDEVDALTNARKFDEASACADATRIQFAALRADVIKVAVDLAKRHQAAERWPMCLAAAEKVLGWEPKNAAALALKEEAESHLAPKIGSTKTITLPGGVKMDMVWCPAGSFIVGSPESDEGRWDNETQHRVTLTEGFWMGKYPVTQRQWAAIINGLGPIAGKDGKNISANPSYFSPTGSESDRVSGLDTSDFPVENVSWDDCDRVIRALNNSRQDGLVFSLPTEAQWEYAAKGGEESCRYRYAGGDNLDALGWYYENSGVSRLDDSNWNADKLASNKCRPHSVREKDVGNRLGLVGMSGNVYEWCADWYGDYPTGEVTDPTGPASGALRVVRGGGWGGSARRCRSANRDRDGPGSRYYDLGLRLVGSAGPRR